MENLLTGKTHFKTSNFAMNVYLIQHTQHFKNLGFFPSKSFSHPSYNNSLSKIIMNTDTPSNSL